MTAPTYLTLTEASARLRLSKPTIAKLVRMGKLASVRISRNILIDERDLDYFVAAHRTGPERQELSPSGYIRSEP